MGKAGFAFGLNAAKKPGATAKTANAAPRKAIFGGGGDDDSDSDHDSKRDGHRGEDIAGELDLEPLSTAATRADGLTGKGTRLKNQQQSTGPPSLKSKSKAKPNPSFGDLSSALTAQQHTDAAREEDPNVFEYDAVYDSLKPKKKSAEEASADEEARRKPKYMASLAQAAEVRKRDALIAEEKKIARERAAEGDEFADKEKFVTDAYRRQQKENRRLEEEEKRREAEEARRNKGGGMAAFYRQLLDKGDERHAQVLKATRESAANGQSSASAPNGEDDEEDDDELDRDKADAAMARELNKQGIDVALNDDGQVVDKRQLLKGGLNLGTTTTTTKKNKQDTTRQDERNKDGKDRRPGGSALPSWKQGMRERQSRMLEEQLAQSMKRSREAEDAGRQELEQTSKSRKTEGEISGARERYLARKKAAEEAKSKGMAG